MKTAQDVESYILKLSIPFEQVSPDLFILKPESCDNIVVSVAGPVVAYRLKVMELPKDGRERLFQLLLTMNTTELVHGAFGLEGNSVVLVHALELENLDLNEFQAVVDDMTMAVAKLHPTLAGLQRGSSASTGAAT